MKKEEKYILLDTREKELEFRKWQVAFSWLEFLKLYRKELEHLKFKQILTKSFGKNELKYKEFWLHLIIGNLYGRKLSYSKLVEILEKTVMETRETLRLPQNKNYFIIKKSRKKRN